MRILIVKTSSMGDVIHTLPAITELGDKIKDITIDWVVEDSFIDIPKYHKYINKIIPVATRKWRKNLFCKKNRNEIKSFLQNLRSEYYDYVIDAQGLLKSVLISKFARAKLSHGLDAMSARGKYIDWLYDRTYNVKRNMHAIYRLKLLFAKIFNYQADLEKINYGLDLLNQTKSNLNDFFTTPYLVFLHCTTWESKKWPKEHWLDLTELAIKSGYNVLFNSGNPEEYHVAQQFVGGLSEKIYSNNHSRALAMPPQSIENLMKIISNSQAVVSVDTGLGHLAAALDKPGVGLFGATDPALTGFLSDKFYNFKSGFDCSPCLLRKCNKLNSRESYPPCYKELSSAKIWEALEGRIWYKKN